jgi:hypothetical protein
MKSGVVEGEPSIFPDPIARLLRAIGRLIPRRRREATKPPEEVETGDPAQDRHQQ